MSHSSNPRGIELGTSCYMNKEYAIKLHETKINNSPISFTKTFQVQPLMSLLTTHILIVKAKWFHAQAILLMKSKLL